VHTILRLKDSNEEVFGWSLNGLYVVYVQLNT